MRSVTLQEMLDEVRTRTEMEDTTFVTDVELISYINASIAELYELLVRSYGDNYYIKSVQMTLLNNQTQLALPSDFFKMVGIDLVEGTNNVALRRFDFKKRNQISALMYNVMGNNIQFTNNSKYGDKSLKIWYVPCATKLASASDSFDGINGWEEYVYIDVMIKVLGKEQSEDIPSLMARKQEQKARIIESATNRDQGEPERVSIVRNRWVGRGLRYSLGDDEDDDTW